MEGKNFLRADSALSKMQATPPAGFSFDLQRFDSEETPASTLDTEKITGKTYVFSCEKVVDGLKTTYYGTKDDFTTDKLKDVASITLLDDVTVSRPEGATAETTPNADAALTLSSNCVLDLASHTLTINDYKTGIFISNGVSLELKNTGNDAEKGKIVHNFLKNETNFSTIKNNRTNGYAAIGVGTINSVQKDNLSSATFTMKGGTIESYGTAVRVASGGNVSLTEGCNIESKKGCGVFFGNQSTGGGSLTMTGGTIKAGADSNLPAIQVTGNVNQADATKNGYGTVSEIEINISGGRIEYLNESSLYTGDETTGISYTGNPAAIYNGGRGAITISGNTVIESFGTGIETRAGSLTVKDTATINSKATTYVSSSKDGVAVFGAGISVAQHSTDESITVNVSEEAKIYGCVALSVANPKDSNSKKELTVNISGGTFEGTKEDTPIAAANGDSRVKVNITGGNFNGELRVAKSTSGKFSLNQWKDAAETEAGSETKSFIITNGTFYNYKNIVNYLNAASEKAKVLGGAVYYGSPAEMLAEAYQCTVDGVTYYYTSKEVALSDLTDGEDPKIVAGTSDNVFYTTFEKAYKAATDSDGSKTVKLYANISSSATATIDEDLTLDLNGQTFSVEDQVVEGDDGTSSTITADGTAFSVGSGVNFTLTDSVGTGSVKGKTNAVVVGSESATFNFSGGTITTDASDGTDSDVAVSVVSGATFNMTGGTIDTDGIGLNNSGTALIKGGKIYSNESQAIYNQNDMLKVLGGLISGRIGIEMLLGTLKVLGGKIRGIAA